MENLSLFVRKVLSAIQPDEDLIDEILHPRDLYPVSASECIQAFKKRIDLALENNEKILIAGDYDCDGIMSTTILHLGLGQLGLVCGYYIPDRIKEGYGLSVNTVQMAYDRGYSLIITCDNGVLATEALAKARELNIEVMVTDHHILPEHVDCEVLVHPDLLEPCFSSLCGAGVAFECVRALGIERDDFIEYAAIASIADCMRVGGQTRSLIQKGLALLNEKGELHLDPFITRRPINERDAAFQIAPKINAVGRLSNLANVNTFVRYMESKSPTQVASYAHSVNQINDRRKELSAQVYGKAQVLINPLHPVLFAVDEQFLEGIIGLAAGNLCSQYGKAVIIGTITDEGVKCSMRAPKGFHCMDFLADFDGFLKCGGHEQAAGMTIDPQRYEDFKEYVLQKGRSYKWEPQEETLVDIEPDEINVENVRALDAFRPFGQGFELPRFILNDPQIVRSFDMSQGAHRKFMLSNGVEALHFNQSAQDAHTPFEQIDALIGTLNLSTYRNEKAEFLIDEIIYK
ncbi:MAG: DHH family phosphoesterase [Allobaculum sp.]